METWVWIIIAVGVVALLIGALVVVQGQRRRRLRERFGQEYDRTVAERGDRRQAERELSGRYQRRSKLDIRPLDEDQHSRYDREWRNVQARFVETPRDAIQEADILVMAVMRDRGYPVADFEQRAADVSVDHADVVENYRVAHDISQRSAVGRVTTEELRQGMLHYRALFQELLSEHAPTSDTTRTR